MNPDAQYLDNEESQAVVTELEKARENPQEIPRWPSFIRTDAEITAIRARRRRERINRRLGRRRNQGKKTPRTR